MISNYWDIHFFQELSPSVINKFKRIKTCRCKYCSGTIILCEGDLIESVGFVLNGLLKATEYTNTGKELNTHYFYEGDIIPELMVLSGIQHYTYNLVCEKGAEIEWIPLESFQQFIYSENQVMEKLLKHVSLRAYQNEIRIRCLYYQRMNERLAYYLLNNNLLKKDGYIYTPFSQKVLADQMNVSRSVLNQEIITFEELGWIKREKDRIKILKPEKLKEIL